MYITFCHFVTVEGKRIKTNGICKINRNKKALNKHYDISINYNAVKCFVKKLNEEKIESHFLEDAIDDFFSDEYNIISP